MSTTRLDNVRIIVRQDPSKASKSRPILENLEAKASNSTVNPVEHTSVTVIWLNQQLNHGPHRRN